MKRSRVISVLLFASVSAHADVTPSPVFADHMVLQREMPVAVFGVAAAGLVRSTGFPSQ